jgi:hypothetical protein
MHFEIAVIGVSLAGEQALQLAPGRLRAQPLKRRFGVGDDGVVALGLAELDQLKLLADLAFDPPIAGDRLVEPGALAQQLLGRGGIIPQVGVFDLCV